MTPQNISRILGRAGFKSSQPYPGRVYRHWTEGFEVQRINEAMVRVEWRSGSFHDMPNNEYLKLRDEWLEKYRQVIKRQGYLVEYVESGSSKFLKVV